jgi:hypothetical protein
MEKAGQAEQEGDQKQKQVALKSIVAILANHLLMTDNLLHLCARSLLRIYSTS